MVQRLQETKWTPTEHSALMKSWTGSSIAVFHNALACKWGKLIACIVLGCDLGGSTITAMPGSSGKSSKRTHWGGHDVLGCPSIVIWASGGWPSPGEPTLC